MSALMAGSFPSGDCERRRISHACSCPWFRERLRADDRPWILVSSLRFDLSHIPLLFVFKTLSGFPHTYLNALIQMPISFCYHLSRNGLYREGSKQPTQRPPQGRLRVQPRQPRPTTDRPSLRARRHRNRNWGLPCCYQSPLGGRGAQSLPRSLAPCRFIRPQSMGRGLQKDFGHQRRDRSIIHKIHCLDPRFHTSPISLDHPPVGKQTGRSLSQYRSRELQIRSRNNSIDRIPTGRRPSAQHLPRTRTPLRQTQQRSACLGSRSAGSDQFRLAR